MAKILIVYDSRSGNTEKMALAVAEGARKVKGTTADALKVDKVSMDDLLGSDGIVVGSPTYYGLMSAKIKKLFDDSVKIHGKLAGKAGAAFTSSGGSASGAETTLLSILQAMLVHGMIVEGRADNKHYGAAAVEAPDKETIEVCEELGKRVARLATKLKS